MKHRFAAAVVAAAITPALVVPAVAPAHRSGCHSHHSCPSDHATYKWRGKLCVKPTSPKRTSAFKRKVRYGGYTYYCK
jgi:hypothetical protein